MPHVDVVVPDAHVTVRAAADAAVVVVPAASATVLAAAGPATVTVPTNVASVICDDALASSFTTPALTHWELVATDLGLAGARIVFSGSTTSGSPCRVKFTLTDAGATQDYATRYSSPDQTTPHDVQVDVSLAADRGLTYDLYWSWTSGNEAGGPTLVAANAVYVPGNGEGDFPAEG